MTNRELLALHREKLKKPQRQAKENGTRGKFQAAGRPHNQRSSHPRHSRTRGADDHPLFTGNRNPYFIQSPVYSLPSYLPASFFRAHEEMRPLHRTAESSG